MKRILLNLAALCAAAAHAQVTKPTVEGIMNFAQVETTVACTDRKSTRLNSSH